MRRYHRPFQFKQHQARSLRIFQRRPETVLNFEHAPVRIWSEEHGAYWRLLTSTEGQFRGAGYVVGRAGAGIVMLPEAFRMTRHCGPEKEIWFEFVSTRERLGQPEETRTEAELAIRAERDIEIAGFLDGYASLVRSQRTDPCAGELATAVEGLASSLRAGIVD